MSASYSPVQPGSYPHCDERRYRQPAQSTDLERRLRRCHRSLLRMKAQQLMRTAEEIGKEEDWGTKMQKVVLWCDLRREMEKLGELC